LRRRRPRNLFLGRSKESCEPAEEKGDGEERAEHLKAKKVGRAAGAAGGEDQRRERRRIEQGGGPEEDRAGLPERVQRELGEHDRRRQGAASFERAGAAREMSATARFKTPLARDQHGALGVERARPAVHPAVAERFLDRSFAGQVPRALRYV